MSIDHFLETYKKLATNTATEKDVDNLHAELVQKAQGTEYANFLANCDNRTDKALAIDSIAALAHRDPTVMNLIYGWDVDTEVVRKSLDELSGNESEVDIRRGSRGYFSTLKSADHFEILE